MPLPFDIAAIDQVMFNHPGITPFGLPKYDSVTPAEELAIIPILRTTAEGLDAESMVRCQQALATLALHRIHPDQSEGDTALLPLALVKDLADFLLNERRGWEPVDEEAEDTEKKLTGTATKPKSPKSSPNSTGDLAPGGPPASTGKGSARSPSPKSEKPA